MDLTTEHLRQAIANSEAESKDPNYIIFLNNFWWKRAKRGGFLKNNGKHGIRYVKLGRELETLWQS